MNFFNLLKLLTCVNNEFIFDKIRNEENKRSGTLHQIISVNLISLSIFSHPQKKGLINYRVRLITKP